MTFYGLLLNQLICPLTLLSFYPIHLYRDLGLELFGSCLINQEHVQRRIVKGILALIHRERYIDFCHVCLYKVGGGGQG